MNHKQLTTSVATVCLALSLPASADLAEAFNNGKAYGDFRLRYENVDQDNAAKNGNALTLRSRIGYKTAPIAGVSALVEFEDSRNFGNLEHNNTQNGVTSHSVIADPETTEVDQYFLQYADDVVTAKVGRQVITLDNHRFVGHVGFRQDRQTFDGASIKVKLSSDVTAFYAYLTQRNFILAEARDTESDDHLFNLSYATKIGKLSAYGYFLNDDDGVDDALDTVGLRFAGKAPIGDGVALLYAAEYARQTQEVSSGSDLEANYYMLEGGAAFSGIVVKAGYEVLGSDDGNYGFSTPLATLHKFNGWTDQFLGTPAQGLQDAHVKVIAPLPVGKVVVAYHDFSADDAPSGSDDFGSEFNVAYSAKFAKQYNAGVKYGRYEAGDIKVDTERFWVWVGMKF